MITLIEETLKLTLFEIIILIAFEIWLDMVTISICTGISQWIHLTSTVRWILNLHNNTPEY